ncbi:MAG TPA: hypothetical protein VGG68_03365 [Caulobacteraceae bacterium]|jgi:DNA-binding transcriptional LysR family regulator
MSASNRTALLAARSSEDWSPAYPAPCLYYPSRRNLPAKLRAFIELIRKRAN